MRPFFYRKNKTLNVADFFTLKDFKIKKFLGKSFHDIATTNLGGIFENRNFNALNLPFENVIIAITLKCCGMEDRTVVTYGGRETQKANIQGYLQRMRLYTWALWLYTGLNKSSALNVYNSRKSFIQGNKQYKVRK